MRSMNIYRICLAVLLLALVAFGLADGENVTTPDGNLLLPLLLVGGALRRGDSPHDNA